jgi:hypothetical protein
MQLVPLHTGAVTVDLAASTREGLFGEAFPSDVRGGFLLEAMGLGKTVEMIALMKKNPPPPVGLCRLNPRDPQLESRLVSTLEPGM